MQELVQVKRLDLNTRSLADVQSTLPADEQVLAWSAAAGQYVPTAVMGGTGLFDPTNILINASLSGALRVHDGTDDWIRVNTNTPAINFGNTTDNPVFNLLGTGRVAKVTGSNMMFGYQNTVQAGATQYIFGDLTAVTTSTGDSKVLIGRLTNVNLAGPRVVAISAAGMTGSPGNDSVTVQGSGGVGATGNRAVSIGGAGSISGNDSQALGYGHSLAHANCIGLGRGATSTAVNQFIVGSALFPTNTFFLGEGVTRASPMTSASIIIQPTEVTGTNAVGVPLHLLGGRGTGSGAGGSLVFRTYPAGAAGTTAHTAATRLEIDSSGAWLVNGTAGTSGQALFSQGAGVTPNWADIPVTLLTPVDIAEGDPAAYQIATISGAGDNYFLIDTTIGSESLYFGNAITLPAFRFLGEGGIYLGTNPLQINDNLATAFRLREGSNEYIHIRTTNGGEWVTLGNATTNPDFIWLGSGEWRFGGSAGTSGQVLTSSGAGAAPTWTTAAAGFDPTNVTINASLSGALRVHDGTDDWIRVNTNTPAINFGNTTDNPAFTFLGSGVLTLGSGRVAKTGNILIGDHTVAPSGTGIIAIGGKASGSWTSNNQIIIGTTTGNYGVGAIVLASQTMTGNAGANSVTIGTDASAVSTGSNAVGIGATALASNTAAIAIGPTTTASGQRGIAIGDSSSATATAALAIGYDADVTAADGIAIGQDADAGHRALCIGRAAASTAASQVVIGGNGQPLSDYYLGEGVTKSTALTATEISIRPTERTGTNAAGVPLWLVGGRGTGTGVAGSIFFKGYPSGSTGTTPHTIATLWEMKPTGQLARATAENVIIGFTNTAQTSTTTYILGDLTAVTTATGNDRVLIGRHTNTNLANARVVAIAAAGGTGNYGADSVTVQSAGGAGATGNRAILIGGAGTVSGSDAQGVGYGLSLTHANCIGLGRGATSSATNQIIFGGDGFPAEQMYIGEGVTESGGFSASAIGIQPTEATGTNRAGLALTIRGGRGTGTGNSGATDGSLNFATYPAGSTGTTAHTSTPRLKIRADGVRLSSSHNTMSTAAERDEAEHFQTGAVDMPTASTTYTVLVIAPENTANDSIYTVEGMITGYADTTPAARISFFYRLTFECVSGTPSIIRYWVLDMETGTTGWVSGSPPWADVSGSTVRIRVSTAAGQTGGRAIATARWHGTQFT